MKKLFYNQILDKKGTKKILSWFLENYGPTRTSQFIEQLKSIGFHFATEAGLSLGFDDLKIPEKKSVVLNTADSDVSECEKRYFQGKITAVERYQKFIDIWTTASENLKDEVIQNFQDTDLFNPLYMMAFSGARGNISQVRQLVGMRGLMSDSAGGIIDFPIRSNFREGLTVTEYAISCYGARKGLIDTALRTADSGYLTRRLVDVAHGIMIGRLECLTKEAFEISPLKSSGKSGSESILLSLEKRIVGRVLAEDILKTSPSTSFFVAKKNQEITPSLAQKIVQFKKETVQVRSPLTCLHFHNLREDICQLCYGWSLAHGRLVSIGEAVGILAAQSIGEPGTQLTMRTFHTGGIFSTDIDDKIFAPHNGIVSFSKKAKGRKVRTFHGQTAFFTFEPIQLKISFCSNAGGGAAKPSSFSIFRLPSQSLIFVYPGQVISKNILCAEVSQLTNAKGAVGSTRSLGNEFEESSRTSGAMNSMNSRSEQLKSEERSAGGENDLSSFSTLQGSDEEGESDEVNKPNSKKVLSELEGQIYFHRLAQRRQITEFEKLSYVKGVGSLWVLAGKSVFLEGPFQPGDFISKSKKPTYFSTSPLRSRGLRGGLRPPPLLLKKAKLPSFLNFHEKIKTVEIQYYRLDQSILALQGNYTTQKASVTDGRRGLRLAKGLRGVASTVSAPRPPQKLWLEKQTQSFFPRSTLFTFQNEKNNRLRISKKISEKFNNRNLAKFHFDNFDLFCLNGRSQLHPGYFYFKQKTPLVECAFLKIFTLSTSGFFIQATKETDAVPSQFSFTEVSGGLPPGEAYLPTLSVRLVNETASPGEALGASFARPVLLNKNSFIFIQNLKNENFENVFVETKKVKNAQALLKSSKGLRSSTFTKPHKEYSSLSNFQFEHGELRFFLDGQTILRKASPENDLSMVKNSGATTRPIEPEAFVDEEAGGGLRGHRPPSRPTTASFVSAAVLPSELCNFSQFSGKSLNLRTSDLRFYKISEFFQKKVSSNGGAGGEAYGQAPPPPAEEANVPKPAIAPSAPASFFPLRKIGELVRVGDQMEVDLGLDKTTQILRRTLTLKKEFFYTLRRVHPYLISNHSPLAVNHGDIVEARQYLFELFYQQSKTGDIVQGLPKIEQLFEARRTSLHVIETVHVKLKEKFQELCNQYPLYEAARLSIRFIQRILIDEIQLVYQSQGVDIADKHIEIIIRQMTSKVIIHEKGKGPFFPDDIIDFHQIGQFELEGAWESGRGSAQLRPRNPARPQSLASNHNFENLLDNKILSSSAIVYEPIVLGLTKIAFLTQSFISAASFQETKRVLMNSALQSRVDFLYGLKENVIVGRFIRAGTGFRTSLFPSV